MKKLLLLSVFSLFIVFDILAQCYGGSPTINNPTSYSTSNSIHINYNNARRWEEANLGLTANCLGNMLEPSVGWGNMSDDEIALYIHNSERIARGFLPFYGIESNLDAVAQAHSDWLIANDVFSHGGNPALGTGYTYTLCSNCSAPITGSSPFNRMNQSYPLNGQWESESENIASRVTSGSSISDFVASSIYLFLYQDSGSAWGHRLNILANYNNNWGSADSEGFIGVGVSSGFGFQACAYVCTNWNYAKILTVDYYNPQGGASGFNFGALPYESLVFNAKPQNKEVLLTWNTSNELNCAYFSVEKSTEGNDFYEIGKVTASNNSFKQKSYSFIDHEFESTIQYYRLKQYDLDNSYRYSNILAVSNNLAEDISIYPNPVTDYFYIDFKSIQDKSEITLSDVKGKLVYSNNTFNGENTVPIDVSGLHEGIYILQIKSSSGIHFEKIIKTSE